MLTPYRRAVMVVVLGWFAASCYTSDRYGAEPGEIHRGERPWNGEVSRHFLNILGNYSTHTLAEHAFAPTAPCVRGPNEPCIVSELADAPGMAVVHSARLDRAVYTSYPPGAMVLLSPIVLPVASLFDAPPMVWLRVVNQCLGLLTALLFLRVLDRLLEGTSTQRTLVLMAAATPLVLSVEVLHSHHVSMWAQQVMQPVIAAVALLTLGPMRPGRVVLLGGLCALGCWIEWSAFLLGAAVAGIVWWRSPAAQRRARCALFVGVFSLGGLSLLAYYDWLLGLERYVRALGERFVDRSVANHTYDAADWLTTLLHSYLSAFLFILVLAGRTLAPTLREASESLHSDPRWLVVAALCGALLLENLLLFQHAIVYSFDRLKWVFLLALAIGFLGQRLLLARAPDAPMMLSVGALLCGATALWHVSVLYVPYW